MADNKDMMIRNIIRVKNLYMMIRTLIMEESMDRILSQMRKRTKLLAGNMDMIRQMKKRSTAENMALIMSQKKKRT